MRRPKNRGMNVKERICATLAPAFLGLACASAHAAQAQTEPRRPTIAEFRERNGDLVGPRSPFRRPIPLNARVDVRSRAVVADVFGPEGLKYLVVAARPGAIDYAFPVYVATPGAPEAVPHPIVCTMYGGRCPLAGTTIWIPRGARPETGSDAHLAVIDPRARIEYDLWLAKTPSDAPNDPLLVGWGGSTRLGGDGLHAGATVSGFALASGVIRPTELLAGRIDHALQMNVSCSSPEVRYPAAMTDTLCKPVTDGSPPMGARFQLDLTDAQIDALPAPPPLKAIYRALARYGAFASDTTGGYGIGFQIEGGLSYTTMGRPDPWRAVAARLGVRERPDGTYRIELNVPGFDVAAHMRMLAPCVTIGGC